MKKLSRYLAVLLTVTMMLHLCSVAAFAAAEVSEANQIVTAPEEIAPEVAGLVSREMQGIAMLNVPLTAEAKFGKSWYDAK